MEVSVDVPNGRVVRFEDGIIGVLWNRDVVVEVPDIVAVMEAELSLLHTDEHATVLVDARPVRSMSRAAQRTSAEHPIAQRTAAVAILVDGPISRMLGNFFLSVSRPLYPTRLFSDEGAARGWLGSHHG